MIGRFYSNDPIGFRDVHSFNRYAYVNNNPYKYTDPDGRDGVLVGAGVGCALTGPACPAGAAIGATVGLLVDVAIVVGVGILAYNVFKDDTSSDSNGEGKKAKDSGKNSKHGKNGSAGTGDKAKDQIADLEKQLANATGKKEKAKISQKLKNIKKTNDEKNKGEEHGKRKKK